MREINKDKVHMNIFDNIYDLTSFLTSKPRKPGRSSDSDTNSFDFSGTHSFQEALDLISFGDEETLKEILKEKHNIKIDKSLGNVTNRQRYENNLYGCIPNVPSYLKGNPINMINSVKDQPSHKIVNIFLNMDCNGSVSKNDILKAGVKYLSVIDILEKRGYRCNLYAGVSSHSNGGHDYLMLVRVKTDREPLNIKKICFTIANPSFLRRIYFRWVEVFDFSEDLTGFCEDYGGVLGSGPCKRDFKECLKDNFIIWCYQDEDTRNCDIETVFKRLKEEGISID